MIFARRLTLSAIVLAALVSGFAGNAQQAQQRRTPDVVFVPTPYEAVEKMLELGEVNKNSVVYDLGCGDGRIVVTAAKKFGARGVGIDIDPERIQESRENAKREGVTNSVEFREADLFETDLRPATTVTLYLLPELNLRLRPRLLEQLKPGTPIVSHDFDMGDWEPEKTEYVDGPVRRHTIYRWTVPQKTAGVWNVKPSDGSAPFTLELRQDEFRVSGKMIRNGEEVELKEAKIQGENLSFLVGEGVRFTGQVKENSIQGVLTGAARESWSATRAGQTTARSGS